MNSCDTQLLDKTREQHERTVAFQDQFCDQMSSDLLDKINESVSVLRDRHGVECNLPLTAGEDLECTRFDLWAPSCYCSPICLLCSLECTNFIEVKKI